MSTVAPVTKLSRPGVTGSAAVKDVTTPSQAAPSEQPSIIIVEVIGYGCGDGGNVPAPDEKKRKGAEKQSYNTHSAIQYLGAGPKTSEQKKRLLEQAGIQ
jgi:hypothetical protein